VAERLRLRVIGALVLLACLCDPGSAAAGEQETIGHSVQGRPIVLHKSGPASATLKVLVVGAIHGNEMAGMRIARSLIAAGPHPPRRPPHSPDDQPRRRRRRHPRQRPRRRPKSQLPLPLAPTGRWRILRPEHPLRARVPRRPPPHPPRKTRPNHLVPPTLRPNRPPQRKPLRRPPLRRPDPPTPTPPPRPLPRQRLPLAKPQLPRQHRLRSRATSKRQQHSH